MPFSTVMGLDFIYFWPHAKSRRNLIYISDEAVHSQTARPRNQQTDRKQTFHRTTTLQAGLINQVDNDSF